MSKRVIELRRKQNEALEEAKGIHAKGVKEARALTEAEETKYRELMASVEERQKEIEREEELAIFGDAGAPASRTDIGMEEPDLQQYSLLRAIRALATGDWRDAEMERDASDAVAKRLGRESQGLFVPGDWMASRHSVGARGMERRVVNTSGAADLIATEIGSFIDVLRNRMVLRAAGAVMLAGLVGNVDLPKRTAGASISWVAEGSAPGSEGTQTFGAVALTPKTGSVYVDVTRRTLNQSSLDMEMLIRDDLIAALQVGLDLAGLHGSGASNQPTGVASTSGIGSVVGGTNGAAPDWADIVDLETAVAIDNADIGRLAYITNAKVRGKLKQTAKVSSTDSMMVWDVQTPAQPLNGYNAFVTNQVSSTLTKGTASGVCSAIFFGNWADLVLAMWDVLEITADVPDNRTGTVRVAGIIDADVAVRHAESFAAMLDALTT